MKKNSFFLFLLLGFGAFLFTSCVKDEEDPEYTSYQTKAEEPISKESADINEAKSEAKLLAEASQSTQNSIVKSESKDVTSPITFTPTKEEKREVAAKNVKPATETMPTPAVAKKEVPASELKKEAATSKVSLPAPVTNDRGLVAKGVDNPRIVRGTNAAISNRPTPVVTEPTLSQPTTLRGKTATFSVDKSNHEFGFIDEGTKITHVFTIKNTGGADLYINDVKPSCNCTVPDFSIESVPPGGSTTIKLIFDSNGKVGTQRKTATVMTNIGEYEISMTGTVRPKTKNY